MKIEDVMTRRVVAARADTDLAHVARLMWDNDCGAVPVVDAEDQVVGILTDRDVCMGAHFSGRALREARAGGSMASEVASCRPEDSLATAAATMGERRVRRLPVVDEGGRLVGLVSLGDLVRAAAGARPKERKALEAAVFAALAAICARASREEVPAQPPKAKSRAAKPARAAKPSRKKRART